MFETANSVDVDGNPAYENDDPPEKQRPADEFENGDTVDLNGGEIELGDSEDACPDSDENPPLRRAHPAEANHLHAVDDGSHQRIDRMDQIRDEKHQRRVHGQIRRQAQGEDDDGERQDVAGAIEEKTDLVALDASMARQRAVEQIAEPVGGQTEVKKDEKPAREATPDERQRGDERASERHGRKMVRRHVLRKAADDTPDEPLLRRTKDSEVFSTRRHAPPLPWRLRNNRPPPLNHRAAE